MVYLYTMDNQIICPNCKKPVPLTQAISAQIQEKYQAFYRKRLLEEKVKLEQNLKEQLTKQLKAELDLQLKDRTNELEELRKQNKLLQEQLLDLNKLIRQLRFENDQKSLELAKKLTEEQEKIRQEEKKRIDEEYKLKILEKDKKLNDALRLVDDYKRKLEQGSQQLQGEVLELELENILKREFPFDEIMPIPKGFHGADVLQVVKNKFGRICGKIIWESKRTKAWSNDWINKLKGDQREAKAELAVIISQVLPDGIRNFGLENNVWVGNFESIIGLALMLRTMLIEVSSVKIANANRQNKMEVLYSYFSGVEFKQRIEAIVESFNSAQEDLEREKRYFSAKWSKQEKNIRKVFDNLAGMYGDLQSLMGKALPEVEGLGMLPAAEEKLVNKTLF